MKNAVCAGFCAYYKPGRNEELSCRGYAVLEQFLQNGRLVSIPASCSKNDPARTEFLIRELCTQCDFHEDGCDFFLNRVSNPCGGFLLLAGLIVDGVLKPGDLNPDPHQR